MHIRTRPVNKRKLPARNYISTGQYACLTTAHSNLHAGYCLYYNWEPRLYYN